LPQFAVHWFGLAPVAIGIKQLLSSTDTDSRTQPESAWSIATITFANCSDNLAIYTPLFGKFSPWQVGLIVITFYLLLFLYVISAHFAASRLKRNNQIHIWAHRIAPLVIIGIGLAILFSH
jgi:cadmium resistance protein CadD (predicted permease)